MKRLKIHCIIVSEHDGIQNDIRRMLDQFECMQLDASLNTAAILNDYLVNHPPPELIFVDNDLPGFIEPALLSAIALIPLVIVIAKGQVVNLGRSSVCIVGNLYKPFSFGQMSQLISKLSSWEQDNKKNGQTNPEHTELYVSYKSEKLRVPVSDIVYLEVRDHYIFIYTQQKRFEIHSTLKDIKARLPPGDFIQIHRSYIVCHHHIDNVTTDRVVVLQTTLPVSKRYEQALQQVLKERQR